MSEIQSIAIISHETKHDPKPYIAYSIKVTTQTRSWTVQRRYNDFVALDTELKVSVGKAPPGVIPPKHSFTLSLTRSVNNEEIIKERRIGLETYLKSILSHKDPRWRLAYGFGDFLSLQSNTSGSSSKPPTSTSDKLASLLPSSKPSNQHDMRYTSTSWLTEHSALQNLLRSVRASLLKRDTLAQLGDSSSSRSSGVEAKRTIKDLKVRLDSLDKGLSGVDGLGAGERTRREGMVITMKDELSNIERMADAGVRVSSAPQQRSSSPLSSSPPSASRSALLGSTPTALPSRVFGASSPAPKPSETKETRPLDDQSLFQLQKTKMDEQDSLLTGLSGMLRRQMGIGQEIGREIGEQNDLLDELTTEVDRTGGKLGRAKREMNKLNK